MKKIAITLLAALAIGSGSLHAELSSEDFSYVKEWVNKKGMRYIGLREAAGVMCHAFSDDEAETISYVPVVFDDINEVLSSIIASKITYIMIAEVAYEDCKERTRKAYTQGWNAAQNAYQPEPETRKAIPVAAK